MTQRTIVALSVAFFAGLLLWGVWTTVVYLGVPAHNLVYLEDAEMQAVDSACGTAATNGTYWCRGLEVLFLDIFASLYRTTRPFRAYVILSVIAYLAVVAWRGYSGGRFVFARSLRPWHVLAGFALSVWCIGTFLGMGSLYRNPDGQEFQLFYEPTSEVYQGVGEEGLQVLNENYQALLDRGCLTSIGQTQSGVDVYNLRQSCIQISLITLAGRQILFLLLATLGMLATGRRILRLLKTDDMPELPLLLGSFGVGALTWVALLWLLSLLQILTAIPLAILLLGAPLALYRDSRYWIDLLRRPIEIPESGSHVRALLLWLLVSYLALNFLNVVRPFPIGWDDLGSYLNRPKLLASYGAFIPQMATFQWEYLTALPFALFGIETEIAATSALMMNWLAGVIAVLATYAVSRLFLGRGAGLTAALLYYTLPMVGHFSFADMKIDNASYFVSALAILFALIFLFGTPGLPEERRMAPGSKRILLIAGLLAGFAFGIKPTAVLTILLIGGILTGGVYGGFGIAAMAFLGLAILDKIGPLNIYDVLTHAGVSIGTSNATIDAIGFFALVLATVACAAIAFLRSPGVSRAKELLSRYAFLGLGILIAVAPWMALNAWSHGRLSPASVLGFNDYLAPHITYNQEEDLPSNLHPDAQRRFLTPELKLDPEHAACKTDAGAEELDRYWGFRNDLSHYLTLPWRAVMNTDIVGYYVTLVPALLLVPLVLLLPYYWRKEGKWLRYLTAGTFIFLFQWILVGNGILWYGIGMFLGFVVITEAMLVRAPDKPGRWLLGGLIAVSIIVALLNRMWQFDTQKNLFEYPLGKATSATIREITIPHYDDIGDSVVERAASMPDRPYTYRMGTFIAYFIPKNKEIIPNADHQLQFFNCLNQERDHALTLRRLQQLGFNGMIFDTNTATIEKDPNGTLHQKVQGFIDFLNDPSINLDVIVNDPGNGIVYVLLP